MVLKVGLLVVFFAVMVCVGVYARKTATDVNGFVLGGRAVGPWLTAFAYGTSYFSAVIFVGYAGQFGWKFGIASTWIGIGNAVIHFLRGLYSEGVQECLHTNWIRLQCLTILANVLTVTDLKYLHRLLYLFS